MKNQAVYLAGVRRPAEALAAATEAVELCRELVAAQPGAAIMDPVLGRIAVVARGADNELYRVFETAMGSGVWGEWQMLNPYPETPDNAATDPTVVPFIGNAGQSWLIVFRNANDFTRVYERQLP